MSLYVPSARGKVAIGASKDQAPEPAGTPISQQSCPPPGWRPGCALMLQSPARSRGSCPALTGDLSLRGGRNVRGFSQAAQRVRNVQIHAG